MPHIPSNYVHYGKLAPMGPAVDMMGTQPPREKSVVPKTEIDKADKERPKMNSLSIRKYKQDPDRVFEQLFGQKINIDPHSGAILNNIAPRVDEQPKTFGGA